MKQKYNILVKCQVNETEYLTFSFLKFNLLDSVERWQKTALLVFSVGLCVGENPNVLFVRLDFQLAGNVLCV